ncbi:DUF4118 domain-containing protein [Paeniglutamicibacter sp. ORCA_105]|uniref:sensor histidine kinase n=1 Tax=Paeniglutamicibacter sp. ORCA_105 TaxID=3377336 RepID=UPI003894FE7F
MIRGRSIGKAGPAAAGQDPMRTLSGYLLALVLPAAMTFLLSPFDELNLATHALARLCSVIVVAFLGGLGPAVLAAVLDALFLNYFVTHPVGTLTVNDPQDFFVLLVYLGVGITVALVVGLSARRSRAAALSSAEAATLSELARTSLAGDQSSEEFLDQLRGQFQLNGVSVFEGVDDGLWRLRASAGPDAPQFPDAATTLDRPRPGLAVGLNQSAPTGGDRRLLNAYEAHLAALLERERLILRLRDSIKLIEGNRVKTSILRAVSHDLRTPLAGIELALTALRRQRSKTSVEQQEEMLDAVQSFTDRLKGLVGNLLDMSRLSSDSVQVLHEPVTWLEVVPEALAGVPDGAVRVELAPNLPPVDADRGLLERALANLVENAVKYASGTDIVVRATAGGSLHVWPDGRPFGELRVVDHGDGVPADRVVAMFQPFQRLDDASPDAGIGLGLAVAKGFIEAMEGQLVAEPTPGGGLTMSIRLPLYTGLATFKDDE